MRHILSSILSVLSEAEVAGLKLVHVVKDKIRYPLDICTVGVVHQSTFHLEGKKECGR